MRGVNCVCSGSDPQVRQSGRGADGDVLTCAFGCAHSRPFLKRVSALSLSLSLSFSFIMDLIMVDWHGEQAGSLCRLLR